MEQLFLVIELQINHLHESQTLCTPVYHLSISTPIVKHAYTDIKIYYNRACIA